MSTSAPTTGPLGRLLLDLRTRAGLSQEQLSHATGVSVRALADMERGRSRGPQRRTVQALSQALKLNACDTEKLEQAASVGRPRRRHGADPIDHHVAALPRDIVDFTARGQALARIHAVVASATPAHPPVVVVAGQPGLGKTSFAVHTAHILAARFPDGQLALDLRGMDPEPVSPRDALARLLRAMGVNDGAVPEDTEDRSGLFRSMVADRSLLLVLDNATDEEQVRPLLPATGASLTIVTSRHALAGLESVHRIELALLRREESVELLTRIIGAERVEQEAQAARDLVDLCGNLPLAVRIAGQRLASRPRELLEKLVAELAQEERRLDGLRAGNLRVRATFALSYRQLPPATRVLLRRASLAAGPGFSPETAALLADLPPRQAARCAQELTDAGLLQPHPASERYRFHDLLKLFAAEQAAAEDGTEECEAAQDRTARWMLRRATAAALHFDADQRRPPDSDPDPVGAPADREQALAWLEAERAQWLAALRRAQAAGRHRQVLDTAEAMHWFSDITQHWELWVEVFRRSVESARALGSRQEEAVHLNYLSWAYRACAYDDHAALESADSALAVAGAIDDQLQTVWALNYAAAALHRMGRVGESVSRLREAAARLGNADPTPRTRLAELTTLNTLGSHLRQGGHAEQALAIHRRSEAICRAGISGQSPEVLSLYHAATQQHLGNDLAALGRWSQAEAPLRRALAAFEVATMPGWSEPARLDLGMVLRRLNRCQEARTVLLTAQQTLGELNNPRQQEATAELGELDGLTAGT
ncbi:ATP-binding protein [Streptomyces gibsoniae]|uniref:Helix-turn-helix domain-containing protein n=1 Tax=Streptomyces gibsoniae TaxID=3075529 RepID=A0ABU2U9I4_9ACTN|nr:helix-turn-helix domain-containing protein [Streptomyces sp. DSM 41699]MDT0469895.1 helix-turn-helix domain-containing protein [Streptomyces sp. DSM 41699]